MPNNFLDVSTRYDRVIKRKLDKSAQGWSIVGGDVALKVAFPELKYASLSTAASTTPLRSKRGIAYYIHSINVMTTIDADDITTAVYVRVGNPSATIDLFGMRVLPSTVATYTQSAVLDYLTEPGASVYLAYGVGAPTAGAAAYVTYMEVLTDDS